MQDKGAYQVRIFLREDFAEAVKKKEMHEELKPLAQVLMAHDARIDHNQFDEFSEFLVKADAKMASGTFANDDEKTYTQKLADLTRNSLANPEKQSYFKREFTLSMKGKTLFQGDEADALIADLEKLAANGPLMTSGKGFVPGKSYEVPAVRKSFVPKRHPGT